MAGYLPDGTTQDDLDRAIEEEHPRGVYVSGCTCHGCRDIDNLSEEDLQAGSAAFDRALLESIKDRLAESGVASYRGYEIRELDEYWGVKFSNFEYTHPDWEPLMDPNDARDPRHGYGDDIEEILSEIDALEDGCQES